MKGKNLINLLAVMWVGFATSLLYTRYYGPESNSPTLLPWFVAQRIGDLATLSFASEVKNTIPPHIPGTSGGATSLTVPHVIAGGILLSFALVGIGMKLRRTTSETKKSEVLAIAVPTGFMYVVIFIGPMIGLGQVFSFRSFPFLYILITIFAAAGLVAFVRSTSHQTFAIVLFVLLISTSLIGVMGTNYAGASDNPQLDDSAGQAQRFELTSQEHTLFQFTAARMTSNQSAVGDHLSRVVIKRYYDQPAQTIYLTESGERRIIDNNSLLIERPYAYSQQASFYYQGNGTQVRMFGPLAKNVFDCNRGNKIYTNSDDHNIIHTFYQC